MARRYLFVDEAGNFDFKPSGTRYLVLASVALDDCAVGDALLALRRDLVWEGENPSDAFHASEDAQKVRDRVFGLLQSFPFRVDATVFDKAKVDEHRRDEEHFYGLAWSIHMQQVVARVAGPDDELMVVGASLGTRRRQAALAAIVHPVVHQAASCRVVRVGYWPAATDPCLQVADYCCWAVHRKWERGDTRSHALIGEKIGVEIDVFDAPRGGGGGRDWAKA